MKKTSKSILLLVAITSIFLIVIGINSMFSTQTLGSNINFAGYNWDINLDGVINANDIQSPPNYDDINYGGAQGNYNIDSEGFLHLSTTASGSGFKKSAYGCLQTVSYGYTCITTNEEISNVDEFLIIWKGSHNWLGSFGIYLYDKSTGQRVPIKSIDGAKEVVNPEVVKIVNNFDKTYTAYRSLGVGDLYVSDAKVDTSAMQSRYLQICTYAASHCQQSNMPNLYEGLYTGNSEVTVYNIVTKRLETPVCKANQVVLENGTCQNLDAFLLAHESAIYESAEEKLLRIEERLQAREDAINQQIADFNEIMSQQSTSAMISLIDTKIVELQLQRTNVLTEYNNKIASLKSTLLMKEEELSFADSDLDKQQIEEQMYNLRLELNELALINPTKTIDDRISFYQAQKTLLQQGSQVRLEELNNELIATKTILQNLQTTISTSLSESDIEELIKTATDELNKNPNLTAEEIKDTINNEIADAVNDGVGGINKSASSIKKTILIFVLFSIAIAAIIIYFTRRKKR